MDQIESNDNRARASALLGVRLTKTAGNIVGERPTVEEFTALYEGSLGTTRRAQVLGYLTEDPTVYRQWLEVVAAQAALDTTPEAAQQTESQTQSLFARLGAWLREHAAIPAGVGTFAAAALVVVLILPGQEHTGAWDSVDTLYSDYGDDWQLSPSTLERRTVRGGTAPVSASAEQQALYLGLRAGLDELGAAFPDSWLREMPIDATLDALPQDTLEALRAAGQLATLARFQCQLQGSDAFYTQADKTLADLQPVLKQHTSRVTRHLVGAIDQPGEASDRVCDFAVVAVAMLAGK